MSNPDKPKKKRSNFYFVLSFKGDDAYELLTTASTHADATSAAQRILTLHIEHAKGSAEVLAKAPKLQIVRVLDSFTIKVPEIKGMIKRNAPAEKAG